MTSKNQNMYLPAESIEWVEFVVKETRSTKEMFEKMGFETVGELYESQQELTWLYQGDIHILLNCPLNDVTETGAFLKKHGEGIIDLALGTKDINTAQELASVHQLKMLPLHSTWRDFSKEVSNDFFALGIMGDVRHTFVDTKKSVIEVLSKRFQVNPKLKAKGKFLQCIDHVTFNVEKGRMEEWASFYKNYFGFSEVRYFDIRTDKSGLLSRALRSQSQRITIPINEPTNDASQIQEFLNVLNGPGVQHLAFHTPSIIESLQHLKQEGYRFLSVPETYYETILQRIPQLKESLDILKELNLLVDGSEKGYLLQIFTETMIGPFFFELIQRKGDQGFGDGNFRALFEAIERDQQRRGLL